MIWSNQCLMLLDWKYTRQSLHVSFDGRSYIRQFILTIIIIIIIIVIIIIIIIIFIQREDVMQKMKCLL